MKKTILFLCLNIIIFTFVFLAACTKKNDKIETKTGTIGCDSVEPTVGLLKMIVTINKDFPSTKVYIYKGKLEDGVIIDSFEYKNEENYDTVNLNSYYTAVAKYVRGKDTILVVDGESIEKKVFYSEETPCWSVKGGNLNLKLKY